MILQKQIYYLICPDWRPNDDAVVYLDVDNYFAPPSATRMHFLSHLVDSLVLVVSMLVRT